MTATNNLIETQEAAMGGDMVSGISISYWWILLVIFLLAVSAFFSGSETALTAVNRATLHRLAAKGSRAAAAALRLIENGERLIGALLLGNNLVNILATSVAASWFVSMFGEKGVALSTLTMTILVLVFAELAPKIYAITRPETATLKVSRIIEPMIDLFSPFVNLARWSAQLVLRIFGIKPHPGSPLLAPYEEIRAAVDMHHSEGSVVKRDRDMVLATLDLQNREVSEVMQHRSSIFMLDVNLPPQEILQSCLESPYTRVPLWHKHQENIVGVVHAKDLLRSADQIRKQGKGKQDSKFNILDIAMDPWFTPETTSLDDQIREFLRRRSHFAFVVDEYGAIKGLITLEDILEEIVGEIVDEHDTEQDTLKLTHDGSVELRGTETIRDLNRRFDWSLPDDEVATIAGLIIHEAHTIPEQGQIFTFYGFRFEILRRERNQITFVRVTPPAQIVE